MKIVSAYVVPGEYKSGTTVVVVLTEDRNGVVRAYGFDTRTERIVLETIVNSAGEAGGLIGEIRGTPPLTDTSPPRKPPQPHGGHPRIAAVARTVWAAYEQAVREFQREGGATHGSHS
jgi:hypothetical protein